MRTSHELLLRYWHDSRYDFSSVMVCFVDRGAPGDESCVPGSTIAQLDAYYFELLSPRGTREIPYHRIVRILYEGTATWDRSVRARPKKGDDTGMR